MSRTATATKAILGSIVLVVGLLYFLSTGPDDGEPVTLSKPQSKPTDGAPSQTRVKLVAVSLPPEPEHEPIPENKIERLNEAGRLMANGDKAGALRILQAAVDPREDLDVIMTALPTFYVLTKDMGLFEKELKSYEDLHDSHPDNTAVVTILADLYAYANQCDKEIAMRKHLATVSSSMDNLTKLESAYLAGKQYLLAADVIERQADSDIQKSELHLVRKAHVELTGGDVTASMNTCDRLMKMQAADARVMIRLGMIYDEAGNYERALLAFEHGAEIAEHAFRRQRCELEACRMRLKVGHHREEQKVMLQQLAMAGISDRVKYDAGILLESMEEAGAIVQ